MQDILLKRFRAALSPALAAVLNPHTVALSIETVEIQVHAKSPQEATHMFRAFERVLSDLCAVARFATQANRLTIEFPFGGAPIDIDLESAVAIGNHDEDAVERAGGLRQLEAVQERTEALLQMVPETTAIIDQDGTVLATNASSVFPVGSNVMSVVPPEHQAAARQRFAAVKRDGKPRYRADSALQLNERVSLPHGIEIAACGSDLLVLCQPVGAPKLPIREPLDV